MSQACSQAAKASAQDVFCVLEDEEGILKKPTAADYVLPAGRATISQSREYTDSPELSCYLDTLTQYPNAMPPGDFSVPMVVRLTPNAGKPQGEALFVSGLGKVDTTEAKKRKYKLDGCRPTFSLWILHDHTVQFMSGCKPETITMPISLSGPAQITFAGKGKKSGIVGTGVLDEAPTSEVIQLEAGDALAFNVGGFVRNSKDSAEFQIVEVNTEANTLTLDKAPTGWVAGESIVPWLPEPTPIGKEMLNANGKVKIDGVSGKVMESTLTVNLPVQYYNYVGDPYPSESADDKRNGTVGMNTLFKPADARRFGEALGGKEVTFEVTIPGDNGTFTALMPRVQSGSPTLGEDGPSVTVEVEGKLLGVNGNDFISFTIEGK